MASLGRMNRVSWFEFGRLEKGKEAVEAVDGKWRLYCMERMSLLGTIPGGYEERNQ
jgi:hypothetical protein